MNYKYVAIIILNYKTWEDSIKEASLVRDIFKISWKQIIIVDNASPNESEIMLKDNCRNNYIFIASKSNKGYAAGNNIGLKYAYDNGFKYGWILNNDVLIDNPSILNDMLRLFEIDDSLAVVNPDVHSLNGKLFNRDSKRYSFYDMSIGMYSYKIKGRELKDIGGYGYVYRPQGCCMLLDLEKGYKVGFLDENTFLYCEELIYAERLLKEGMKCGCLVNKNVIHNHSKTVKSSFNKLRILVIQNKSFNYYLKQYRGYSLCKRCICLFFYTLKNLLQ